MIDFSKIARGYDWRNRMMTLGWMAGGGKLNVLRSGDAGTIIMLK